MILKDPKFLSQLFEIQTILVAGPLKTWTFIQDQSLMLAHRTEKGILVVRVSKEEVENLYSGGSFQKMFLKPPLYSVQIYNKHILSINVTNPAETPVNVPDRLFFPCKYITIQYPLASIEEHLRRIYLSEIKTKRFNLRTHLE